MFNFVCEAYVQYEILRLNFYKGKQFFLFRVGYFFEYFVLNVLFMMVSESDDVSRCLNFQNFQLLTFVNIWKYFEEVLMCEN